tara:strand:+ start:34 stop:531 length:498 start_codon:yes stop_codon:yes gene_type:complete
METIDFKKLLFKTAFCVMACDGSIDQMEIQEMKKIDSKTTYFSDIDLSEELDNLINGLKNKNIKIVKSLFDSLRENTLSITQELLILEISMRILNADEVIDDSEVRFINLIRSKLDLGDQIIHERFGKIPYLKNLNFDEFELGQSDDIKEIDVTDIKNWGDIDLK